jgi:hypothetical protein
MDPRDDYTDGWIFLPREEKKRWADFHMLRLYLDDSSTPVWLLRKRLRGPPQRRGKQIFLNTLP